ncbi:MAG: aminopeptidase P N-terminal domain-containing protein [Acidobacteriota bacterium]
MDGVPAAADCFCTYDELTAAVTPFATSTPSPAPLSLRVVAGAIDGVIVFTALAVLAMVAVTLATVGQPAPPWVQAAGLLMTAGARPWRIAGLGATTDLRLERGRLCQGWTPGEESTPDVPGGSGLREADPHGWLGPAAAPVARTRRAVQAAHRAPVAGLRVVSMGSPGKEYGMRHRTVTGVVLGVVLSIGGSAFAAGPLLFDKAEYAARRARLMQGIPDGAAIVLGATSTTGGEFFQNNDMMYFTGVEIPNAALIMDGRSRTSTIYFTITERGARNEGINLDLVRNTAAVTGIERVAALDQFTPALARLAGSGATIYTSFKPEELARENSAEKFTTLQNTMTLNVWDGRLTRELQFVRNLRERFPQAAVKDAAPLIWALRAIKSPAEIAHLRKVGRLGVEAHLAMMRATRVGAPEYEMSAAFEYAVRKAGAREMAYNVIISSAENHPYLHYYRHDRVLEDGDFIVVDAGPNLDNYVVDISASYPANSTFTARQREIYEAALAIQEACRQVYRPGIEAKDVQPQVLEILKKQGFDVSKDLFRIRTMQTGVSHSVGMATHDVSAGPRGPFRPGMVFACDIYAVFEGENLGVRIEDTIVITETGCENLTPGLPRTVAEIEAFMNAK